MQGRDGDWNDERVIVFTEYRDTHKWLGDLLKSAGVPKERLASMYGGMPPEQRSAVAQVFNRAPGTASEATEEGGEADLERVAGCDRRVRILLATDTASEGIDLQRFCHDLLHFDVPYNPSRMEQRNGRIDRHGQKHPTADIHTFEADPFDLASAGTPSSRTTSPESSPPSQPTSVRPTRSSRTISSVPTNPRSRPATTRPLPATTPSSPSVKRKPRSPRAWNGCDG